MPSDSLPPVHSAYAPMDAMNTDFQAEYDYLREQLKHLLTAPVKDLPKIDELVDRLELIQLAFKEQHGVKGNNPNE